VKSLVAVVAVVVALVLSGCSAFELGQLRADGAKASAFCVAGNGPPLTGSGHVAGAKADKDFTGSIIVTPDCGVQVESQ